MSALIAIVLTAALQVAPPSHEGGWSHNGGDQIYLFEKNTFRIVVRLRSPNKNIYWPTFIEEGATKPSSGRYMVGKTPTMVPGLELSRTNIVPPKVVDGMALNQPKRFVRLETINAKTMKINGLTYNRVDPKSVPSTLEQAKTMHVKGV